MDPRRVYALQWPAGRPFSGRLFRFQAPVQRSIWMARGEARWRAVPHGPVRALAARLDARQAWRYEGPGVWSARLGPWRSAWWCLRG